MSKTAIITGVTGQDGSHLADLLLEKGYKVVGLTRRVSTEPPSRMRKHLWDSVIQVPGDLTDSYSIEKAIKDYQPDEFYNLGAQSFVAASWTQPEATSKIDYFGALNCLKAISLIKPDTKFYQASTSEMFGKVEDEYQNEKSRFYPRSPYAIAKLGAHWLTVNFRESFGLFSCAGILFNHEGPRRGKEFVTRKISNHVAHYSLKLTSEPLRIGNMNSLRDWGYAPDYVRAMWLMLQQEKADDFVIGTGESHSIREFIEHAFNRIGITLKWEGTGVEEIGRRSDTNEVIVQVDPQFFRPAEVELLRADASKAKNILGWEPTVTFQKLVEIMVDNDIEELKQHS